MRAHVVAAADVDIYTQIDIGLLVPASARLHLNLIVTMSLVE